jgi:hypothetical protein
VRAEHILRVLEVVFLRVFCGFIKEEVTEKCRKLNSGNMNNYCSLFISLGK